MTSSSVPVAGNNAEPTSTVYSTQVYTVTSCAADVTDCPARSTVVSSSVVPIASSSAAAGSSAPVSAPAAASSVSSSSPVVTGVPSYPAGNATVPGAAGGMGTVTLPKSTASATGSGSAAATTSAVVTAGAGRVAIGGVAAVAGLVAAVFAL